MYNISPEIFLRVIFLSQIMKALILVGGYGTRLRPLTVNYPKSAFPFLNIPMVQHQIEALSKVGVVEVIIAINYQADYIKKTLEPLEKKYNIKLTYSQETQAMGTAGPLKLAQDIIKADNKEGLLFVFNSDTICDFPLKQMLEFHKSHQQDATMVLTKVQDPSRFGVLVTEPNGKVTSFVEKPKQFISNTINAGFYLLNISVIDRIPMRFCMLQKETFPQLVSQGKLYGLVLKNDFWFDTGKPTDYLIAQGAYLDYYHVTSEEHKSSVLIDKSAKVGQNCKLGPNVVIGPNCVIGDGCRLKNCTIIEGSTVGTGSYIENSVISWRCKVGSWVRIQGLSCIAEDVEIKDESRLSECMVLSHKSISGTHNKEVIL